MATLDAILDELLDHVHTRKDPTYQGPRWQITCSDADGGYTVIIELYGMVIVDVFARSLENVKQKAIDNLRLYIADQAEEIANALELSIEEARHD